MEMTFGKPDQISNLVYQYVDTPAGLNAFYQANRKVKWLGLDTEFISERRANTLLCLIQVVTEKGIWLLDCLALGRLDPFLDLLRDPAITLITFGSENDLRIFKQLECEPSQWMDLQVGMGFAGYDFPMAHTKVVKKLLGRHVHETAKLSDWSKRPLTQDQIQYAVSDVFHLKDMFDAIFLRLQTSGRISWWEEEMRDIVQRTSAEISNEAPEILKFSFLKDLGEKEKIFLHRLLTWRHEEISRGVQGAKKLLSDKSIASLMRNLDEKKGVRLQASRIEKFDLKRYGDLFQQFWLEPALPQEQQFVQSLVPLDKPDPREDEILDLLHWYVKARSRKMRIAHSLVFSKTAIRKLRSGFTREAGQLQGWRTLVLGQEFGDWIFARDIGLEVKESGFQTQFTRK